MILAGRWGGAINSTNKVSLVPPRGFEPLLQDPESRVLSIKRRGRVNMLMHKLYRQQKSISRNTATLGLIF